MVVSRIPRKRTSTITALAAAGAHGRRADFAAAPVVRQREAAGTGGQDFAFRCSTLPYSRSSPSLHRRRRDLLDRPLPSLLPHASPPPRLPEPLPLMAAAVGASSRARTSRGSFPRAGDYSGGGTEVRPRPPTSIDAEVERVCRSVDELFASDGFAMEAALDASELKLSPRLVSAVLERFRHAPHPALRFFRWTASRPGFDIGRDGYASMIAILGKARQFDPMAQLLGEMGMAGALSPDAFAIAIAALGKAGEVRRAVRLLDMMGKYKLAAETEMFNCLLDALAKAMHAREAQQLFEEMRDRYAPDVRTYTALLQGWCNVKELDAARRVWADMSAKGFEPDTAAHNLMIDCLLKCDRWAEADGMFEVMKAKGPAPDVRTYTIFVQKNCKKGKMEAAVTAMREMERAGCALDVVAYTCLIVGFGEARRMDRVHCVLREMMERGCVLDRRSFTALIKLAADRGMPEDAVRIYRKMVKNGLRPTVDIYNTMMRSYFRQPNFEMARCVWEEMEHMGICPDVNSYKVFVDGFVEHGRADEAAEYASEMISKGMRAPPAYYGMLKDRAAKKLEPQNMLYNMSSMCSRADLS